MMSGTVAQGKHIVYVRLLTLLIGLSAAGSWRGSFGGSPASHRAGIEIVA